MLLNLKISWKVILLVVVLFIVVVVILVGVYFSILEMMECSVWVKYI